MSSILPRRSKYNDTVSEPVSSRKPFHRPQVQWMHVERLARAAKARTRAAIAEGAEDERAEALVAEGGSH